jgi:hypothetical protein
MTRRTAHLQWRVRLFGIGGGLGLGGVWLDSSWLIYAALIALFAGVALRFVGGDAPPDEKS